MSADNIRIRPALQQDISKMILLLKDLFVLEKDFQFDPSRQEAGLMQLLNAERGRVLVAESDIKIVGMCTGQTVISTAEGGPALLVEDVVVEISYQGKGIGRKLLQTLTDWAGEHGIARLQLLADRNNSEALSFYRKLGWQSTQLICLRTYTDQRRT